MSKPPALVKFSTFFAALTFFALSVFGGDLRAKPTQAQISAIRAACRADYRAHCADVPPGGAAALACLKKNVDSLASACQSAVNAVGGGATTGAAAPPPSTPTPSGEQGAPAAAASPSAPESAPAAPPPAPSAAAPKPTQAQISAIRTACREDFGTYCADVTPGGADALACLKKNADSLSSECRGAVNAIGAPANGAAPPTAAPSEAPAAPSPTAPAAEPAAPADNMPSYSRAGPFQELAIIRRFCGRDYRRLCDGVPPGGGRIIGCLRDNASALSPRCQRALQQMLRP